MGSLFAKIMHMASGPVRPIRRRSIWRFAALAILWVTVSFAVLLLFFAWKTGRASLSISQVMEEFHASRRLCVPICLCAGVILAGLHYVLLRISSQEGRAAFGFLEWSLTLVLVACMAAVPGYSAWHWHREKQLVRICLGYGSWTYADVDGLLAGGRYRELVGKMEKSCRDFRAARLELEDRFVPVNRYSGAGWSYMLITLAAYHPEPFALNAPGSMVQFLCGLVDDSMGDGSEPPKSCEPLALEMIKSKEPIVRIAGLWWLGEKEAFDREVEDRLRAGDTSFQDWKGLGAR